MRREEEREKANIKNILWACTLDQSESCSEPLCPLLLPPVPPFPRSILSCRLYCIGLLLAFCVKDAAETRFRDISGATLIRDVVTHSSWALREGRTLWRGEVGTMSALHTP